MVLFVNYIYDMVADTQFHKFHGRPFARVLYVFLLKYTKYTGRSVTPWVLPGSTGRFCKDDVVHNHSAHEYYITRMEGGVRYICMILLHVKQNNTKAKSAIHMIRELDLVTFHVKDYLSDGTSKIDVYVRMKT